MLNKETHFYFDDHSGMIVLKSLGPVKKKCLYIFERSLFTKAAFNWSKYSKN